MTSASWTSIVPTPDSAGVHEYQTVRPKNGVHSPCSDVACSVEPFRDPRYSGPIGCASAKLSFAGRVTVANDHENDVGPPLSPHVSTPIQYVSPGLTSAYAGSPPDRVRSTSEQAEVPVKTPTIVPRVSVAASTVSSPSAGAVHEYQTGCWNP